MLGRKLQRSYIILCLLFSRDSQAPQAYTQLWVGFWALAVSLLHTTCGSQATSSCFPSDNHPKWNACRYYECTNGCPHKTCELVVPVLYTYSLEACESPGALYCIFAGSTVQTTCVSSWPYGRADTIHFRRDRVLYTGNIERSHYWSNMLCSA